MAIGFSERLRTAGALWWLIAANAVVFVAAGAADFFTGGRATALLALSSRPEMMLHAPWTPLTYMFVQGGILHLLFNMLWLYCFGRILSANGSAGRLAAMYVGGGLAGALVFMLVHALFPGVAPASLMGSSASVLAVAVAVAFETPDMRLHVWPIGPVKLKWIVAAMVALFCIGITGSLSGSAAHLGGAAFGAAYALTRRRGPAVRRNSAGGMQAELDRLLDKVKQSGYESLSAADKRRLFELSYKLKQ